MSADPGPPDLALTAYFGERDRVGGRLVADALLDLYASLGLRVALLVRGAEGFGRLHHLRTDRLLTLSEDLPVIATAVDRRERIEAALDPVSALVRRGLLTLERTRLVGGGQLRDGDAAALVPGAAGGETAKLTVFVDRHERIGGAPAHVAVCALMHARGLAGATVLLGVDGIRDGRRARARFFGANAAVPSTVVAVGDGERIAAILPELATMLPGPPLAMLERVRVCKRDGQLLARPQELALGAEHGGGLWCKLSVYSSQATTVDGRPLALEIVRRLRAGESAGATDIRGVWGFHGDHAPHGDRFTQLRRHVPVVTVSIDDPRRTAAAFAAIDALTAGSGLVTSEVVPALRAASADQTVGALALR